MRDNTPISGRISTLWTMISARLDTYQLSGHLHDREHLRHLYVACLIFAIHIVMAVGISTIALEVMVTLGIFGHDVLHILLSDQP